LERFDIVKPELSSRNLATAESDRFSHVAMAHSTTAARRQPTSVTAHVGGGAPVHHENRRHIERFCEQPATN
jgi:hypothetical protein